MKIFFVGFFTFFVNNGAVYAQSNPYQFECTRFEGSPSFQCAAYSNCRLMGSSTDTCLASSGGSKQFTESQAEINKRLLLEKFSKSQQDQMNPLVQQQRPYSQEQQEQQLQRHLKQEQLQKRYGITPVQ